MLFLTDDWLADVATDYVGKCIIIAVALTLIERSLLDERPAFWIVAGRRGGGKTTTLKMLIQAVTGIAASAAAWSSDDEERRKAVFSYFLAGIPYILWDNIPRGLQIACPHIERSCTTAIYTDRKLGFSETLATSASTIHLFTGNNIAPKGDLASRSLSVWLDADVLNPENRTFKHPDPVRWTDDNRARILAALYTLLLGNPTLDEPRDAQMKTRFKMWWRVVGSAVEHASGSCAANPGVEWEHLEKDELKAKAKPMAVAFENIFASQEEEEEEGETLGHALSIMRKYLLAVTMSFTSRDVVEFLNKEDHPVGNRADVASLRLFFYPPGTSGAAAEKNTIAYKLRSHVGDTVLYEGEPITLKKRDKKSHKSGAEFYVSTSTKGEDGEDKQ
jgi:hypothetical protein